MSMAISIRGNKPTNEVQNWIPN